VADPHNVGSVEGGPGVAERGGGLAAGGGGGLLDQPPYRSITVRAITKYSLSSSRTASGSRDSDSGVNPTRSQNSTEHTRRSATGLAGAEAPGGADVVTGEADADSGST
jgi:hypothetical protein